MGKRPLRIGCGAGFAADRLAPAIDLARDGRLDVMILECVGERTLAFAHKDRLADGKRGYNPYLERRLRALLPHCHAGGVQLITNAGAANPLAAGELAVRVIHELGLNGMRVAVLLGDDVTHLIEPATALWEGMSVAETGLEMTGANAYLGASHLLPALEADLVVAGRVADPSLVLAPLIRHFDWPLDDWQLMGAGTAAGHLIECGMQITGGYFADPGIKDVPDLPNCGYPIAEVDAAGRIAITKLEDAGGLVSAATVKEQLFYEIHDPACYLTPDVTADFSKITIHQASRNRVVVEGADGGPRPEALKATIGFNAGYMAEAGVSYAGPGAFARAELAKECLAHWLSRLEKPYRLDIIGDASLHATVRSGPGQSEDVRLRMAMRSMDREIAEMALWETEALLCCGPAGGGGFRRSLTPSIATYAASIARSQISTRIEWLS